MSHSNNGNDKHNNSGAKKPSFGAPPAVGLRSAMRPAVRREADEPVMRSVAVGPLQRTLHFEETLRRAAPGPGILRPTTGFGRSSGPDELMKQRFNKPPPISKPQARNWEVSHDSLLPRPCDFPLERTSRVVHGATAEVVSRRISDCLQSRSVKAKYSKSETLAKCRNTDFVKFNVRLFSDNDGVLVEVQRLCGDCMSFTRDCRAILDASDGQSFKSKESEQPLYLRLPVSEMSFMKKVELPPLSTEEEQEPIQVAADLLASNRSDSNMLGMESLEALTDPVKTLRSTAVMAAKRVLSPDGSANSSFNMHNFVMSLIIYRSDDEGRFEGTAMEEHDMKLRTLAMTAVSNALDLLAKEDCLAQVVSTSAEWYSDVLIPKLVQNLDTVGDHPHDACLASRCLSTLALSSDRYASTVKKVGGLYALKHAEEVGISEYALLAKDAGKCHNNIVQCCV